MVPVETVGADLVEDMSDGSDDDANSSSSADEVASSTSSEGDPDDADELLALCDQEGAQPEVTAEQDALPRGRGAASVRGVIARWDVKMKKMGYKVCFVVGPLVVFCRTVWDLAKAVDYLLVLTAMKQRFSGPRPEYDTRDLRERMRDAVDFGLREHGSTAAELGLAYSVRACFYFWVGEYRLATPPTASLDYAMECAERFQTSLANQAGKYGRTLARGLMEVHTAWSNLRRTYIDICAAAGHDPAKVAANLDAREQVWSARREALVESWNRRGMAFEEQLQRRVMRKEERIQRREWRRMSREDRQSQRFGARAWKVQQKILRRIRYMLRRWQRHETAVREATAKRAAAESRQEAARLLKERQARWRSMNRRDLTWGDILERRWASM